MPDALAAVLAAATAAPTPRRPVWLDGRRVGSVAEAHLPLLEAEPAHFRIDAAAVAISIAPESREAVLDTLHRRWKAAGVIRAWRDERYALAALEGDGAGTPLVAIERAASRFWGSLTLGAHATGFVRGGDGRPAALWIARRSDHKATDPGRFDNLVGGGVPVGEGPEAALDRPALVRATLVREAWEEAGLGADIASRATAGRVMRVQRDVPEGLQLEWLYAYDLELPPGQAPHNQDGEVAEFRLLDVAEALALAASGTMTVDAALVTLDFALRHQLLPPAEHARLEPALRALTLPASA